MLALFGFFPRPSEEERESERRSWRGSEPMSDFDRVFRQRADLLAQAAPVLIGASVISFVVAVLSALVG